MTDNHITVKILDKSYQIKCPIESAPELQEAARSLDEQMRELRDSGRVIGSERAAIITALNAVYELNQSGRSENKYVSVMADRIKEMQRRIEAALTITEQEELA